MPTFERNFDSKFENVTKMCKLSSDFLSTFSVPDVTCKEIELCLAEALNNVIRHSYKKDKDKPIWLSLCLINNKLEIKITDKGEARTNFEKPILEFDPEDIDSLPEGGMGLFIIDQIMDETNYHIEGKMNSFIMKKAL